MATTPPLAQQMLARAFAAGVPAQGVTGDRVDGHDRRVRRWLEAQPHADVLAVWGQAYVWWHGRPRQVNTLVATLPEDGWTRLSAGDGATGPRWYHGRWLPRAEPLEPGWHRWWLVRRRLSEPAELTASVVCAPPPTTWEAGGRVAGSRWTGESRGEAAKGEVGREPSEVRSWTAWDSAYHARDGGVGPAGHDARRHDRGRHVQQKSAVPPAGQPAGGVQGQAWPGLPWSVPEWRRLLCASCWPSPQRSATGWPGRRGVGGTSPSPTMTIIRVGRPSLERWLPSPLVTTVVRGWGVGLAALAILLGVPTAPWNVVIPGLVVLSWYVYVILDAVLTARRHGHTYHVKSYNQWYRYLLLIVIGAVIGEAAASTIRTWVIQVFKIPSGAMEETLLIGDHIFVKKFASRQHAPARGDLVVFPSLEAHRKAAGLRSAHDTSPSTHEP